MISSMLLAFLCTIAGCCFLKKIALSICLVALPGKHRQHQSPTPLVGGLAVFFSFILSSVLFDFSETFSFEVFFAFCLLVTFGVLDDYLELPFWFRFVLQGIVSYILIRKGVQLTDLGFLVSEELFVLGRWSTVLTVFSMIGAINAVNMIDGLDGLLGLILIVILSAIGLIIINESMAVLIMTMVGALGGFLIFNIRFNNSKPARLFMGDGGSMFLGLFVAWLLISNSQGPNRSFPPVVAIWILAVPLFDTIGVMLRRLIRRRSPFIADRWHTHHLLLEMGLGVNATVLVMVLASVLFAFIGIAGYRSGIAEYDLFFLFLGLFVMYSFLMEYWQRKKDG